MEKSLSVYLYTRGTLTRFLLVLDILIVLLTMNITRGVAQPAGLLEGDMVRVRSKKLFSPINGTITYLSSLSIQIQSEEGFIDIPYSSIQRLEVARGKKSHPLAGMLIGIGGGAFVGGLIGNVTYSPCQSTEFMGCFMYPSSRTYSTQLGLAIGGVLGGVAGLLIGFSSHTTQWENVPIRSGISIGFVPSQLHNGNYRPLLNVRLSINRR